MRGYRKFIATAVVFGVGSIGWLESKMNDTLWVVFALTCLGVFCGFNIWAKYAPPKGE